MVPRLYNRDGSEDIELVPNVWSHGLDPMVGYQCLVSRLASKDLYQGWVTRPKAGYPMF